ncbi:SusC/RagA family TonB-linked outer membrane protein [Chitinophaga vietnamensis]|uniref:SusC/RagA family TonB-linked outer membrane protein n=1 Tax=Chitinophaga vietnamensis TaxID=2593957 RepID=UPI001376124E|nr:SusC/RagA family TonB-linked outer membrane protein [Chitinophaga vietnamensis]
MKMTAILMLTAMLQVSASTYAQRVTLSLRKTPLEKVFSVIRKQTGYSFFWDQQLLNKMLPVNVDIQDASLTEALDACLQGQPLTYEIRERDKAVFIRRRAPQIVDDVNDQQPVRLNVHGRITDDRGLPLAGATIAIKGAPRGTTTNEKGEFELRNVEEQAVLVISMLGYQPAEYKLNGRVIVNVSLARKTQNIGEVMVSTGIFKRRQESFTGAAATYSGEQLNTVGNQNVIQSLKSLDPSFIVIENNLAGSNPNAMPNMIIQGKSSIIGVVDKFQKDPNQPLFILDGFETTLENIIGLDMNRIASVTVLKDASSTAIYGSKAANGVIVIETKLPRPGRMNLSLTIDNTTSFADLRDYNMMTAAEKLQFEKLAGIYKKSEDYMGQRITLDELYNRRLNDVMSGVNTYWMGYPIRSTTMANTYSVQADGGDNKFRYGLGFKYRNEPGVMKGSQRNTGAANVDLVYKPGRFSFSNRILLNTFTAKESEYGSFSTYVNTIPYYKPNFTNKYLDTVYDNYGGAAAYYVWNPLYQAMLPKKDQTVDVQFSNQFQSYYMINDQFRIEAKLALTYGTNEHEVYHSPGMEEFKDLDISQKGSYTNNRSHSFNYQGFLQASYGKTWGKTHEVNIVPGVFIDGSKAVNNGYLAVGFPDVAQISPSFGSGYPVGGSPTYTSAVTRSLSGFVNAYYGLWRKYMVDFDYRRDGSSIFGANKRFTDTWTVGLSWNLHNEAFIKRARWINYLKLRGSIGNPGNQNFASYNSFTTLVYNANALNYFGLGTQVDTWGNNNLAWQKTLKKSLGLDVRLFNERISMVVNAYNNLTDPLVVKMDNAPSVGSSNVMLNVGHARTKGMDFTISGAIIDIPKDRISVRLNVMGKRETTTYGGLGDALQVINYNNQHAVDNHDQKQDYNSININLQRYVDGGHPDDLWAVRSMGIDPATGRELFLTRDGQLTYKYDVADIVKVGNSMPLMQGVIGASAQYKGLSVNIGLRYMLRSQQFNNALFSKVENLSREQIYNQNLDKRALYERWKQVGDKAQFIGIPDLSYGGALGGTNMSSRFIQEENTLSGETISATYNFYQSAWLKRAGLQGLYITGYMNDIFRLSNIKRERGIDYPYARSFSLKLNATF